MNFTIEKEIFAKALTRIQGVVEKTGRIPILTNILLDASEGELRITATDLEIGLRSHYPANVTTEGRITVSAKKLHEIVKELNDSEVRFTVTDTARIEISCGKAVFNVVGLSAEEYPIFPNTSLDSSFKISSSLLKELVEKTLPCVAQDESKSNLTGLYFKAVNEHDICHLSLVATDGHRLAMIDKDVDNPLPESFCKGLVLPRKGLLELKKLAEEGDSDDEITLGCHENNAIASKNQSVLYMRLIDDNFPDYERVVPKDNDQEAFISIDSLTHALRRMLVLTSEKSKGVHFSFKPGTLELKSSNPDLGNANEILDIDYAGPEIIIGYNAKFLLDILQVQDCARIKVLFKDQLSPGLFLPEKKDGYKAVIMPMRL